MTSSKKYRNISVVFTIILLSFCSCCEKDSNEPPIEPTDQKTLKIGPAGGTVELTNGVMLVIPAGALTAEKEIKLSNYKPEDFFDGDLQNQFVIGCEPDGLTFSIPAEIYFPVPKSLDNKDFEGSGGLIDAESGAVKVYPSIGISIEAESMIMITTNHFSKYTGWFWETPPISVAPLEIPHYNQGDSPYCSAACIQMVCEAIKHDEINELYDVIGQLGISDRGVGDWTARYSPAIAGFIKTWTGTNPDRHIWDIQIAPLMPAYIKDRIALGFPVVVFSPTEQHAFVVIGYSGNTFYINDPASVDYDGKLSYKQKTLAEFKFSEMDIINSFVTLSIPKEINCGGRLQTVNIGEKGMSFINKKNAPQTSPTYFFRYDYPKKSGYSFQDNSNKIFDTIPGNVTELKFTQIQLTNTSKTESKSINVWIDIWGQNNKKIHKSFAPSATITVPPNSYKLFQTVIPVSEFADDSPDPTNYRLQATALEVGSKVLDDASVYFTIGATPKILEVSCNYGVKYSDGKFGTAAIEGDLEGEPYKVLGQWNGNTFNATEQVYYDGILFKLNVEIKCNYDRNKIDNFTLQWKAGSSDFVTLKGNGINLSFQDNKYQCYLLGSQACTAMTEIWFGQNEEYFCDISSFFHLSIPK